MEHLCRTNFEELHSLPTREQFVENILLLCFLYYRFKEVLLLLNMVLQRRLMVFMSLNRPMNIDKLSFELKNMNSHFLGCCLMEEIVACFPPCLFFVWKCRCRYLSYFVLCSRSLI